MLQQLRAKWRAWRDRSRAYQVERAFYKAQHAHAAERLEDIPDPGPPPVAPT
jgi:hypothetical protein